MRERLQAEVAHPLRLGFELRDLLDDLPVQPLGRFVQVMLRVVEPVALLVVGIDPRELLGLGQDGCLGRSHYFTSSLVGAFRGGCCRNVMVELRPGPPQIRAGPACERRFCRFGRTCPSGSEKQILPAGAHTDTRAVAADNGPALTILLVKPCNRRRCAGRLSPWVSLRVPGSGEVLRWRPQEVVIGVASEVPGPAARISASARLPPTA